jgi:twitching motility protein PilT
MPLIDLLKIAIAKNASDLHLSDGAAPRFRCGGELITLNEFQSGFQIETISVLEFLSEVMTDKQLQQFQDTWEIDFALDLPDLGRFRVNVFKQNNGISAAIRLIPQRIFSLEELGLPRIFQYIADLANGLVLITGTTGSGKTSSLAALIHYINTHYAKHIITIEDPIEYIHQSRKSLIQHREVQRDTKSFHAALRASLREDPDIILIGELRDLETIRLALTAAETGHLVFATLHTASAAKTINRIIDVFPGDEKEMVRMMLAESLQAVVTQALLKKINTGCIAAFEVMFCTSAIRHLIREDKVAQIYNCIQTNAALGMQTLGQHLKVLVQQQLISIDTAKNVVSRINE